MLSYQSICNPSLLKRCAASVKSSKPKHIRPFSMGVDGVSISDYFYDEEAENRNLSLLLTNLENGKFKFSDLKGIAVKKEDSKTDRLVTAPTVEDRIVHKLLLSVISPVSFKYINTGNSYCGVKEDVFSYPKNGVNTLKAMKEIAKYLGQRKYFVFKADIKKFFDRVPKDKLLQKIQEVVKPDDKTLKLISQIVYFTLGNIAKFERNERIVLPAEIVGISQGSALSPLFANIYLSDFDNAITDKFGDVMIRYVDDLVFFSNSEKQILEIKDFVENFMSQIGLSLSEEKTKIIFIKDEPLEFLGTQINKTGIIEKSRTKIMDHLINEIFCITHRDYRHIKDKHMRVVTMNMKISGVINYYKNYHVGELCRAINKAIRRKQKMFPIYEDLKVIDESKVKPFISVGNWRKLFN